MLVLQQSTINAQQSTIGALAEQIQAAVAAGPRSRGRTGAELPAQPGVAATGTSITVSAGIGGSVSLAGACGAVDPCDLHEDVEGLKVAIAALSSDD